jgi:hypothetical protein
VQTVVEQRAVVPMTRNYLNGRDVSLTNNEASRKSFPQIKRFAKAQA